VDPIGLHPPLYQLKKKRVNASLAPTPFGCQCYIYNCALTLVKTTRISKSLAGTEDKGSRQYKCFLPYADWRHVKIPFQHSTTSDLFILPQLIAAAWAPNTYNTAAFIQEGKYFDKRCQILIKTDIIIV
jgi:hypothetical protein